MIDNIVNGVVDTPEKVGTILVSRGWFMPKEKHELVISGCTPGTLYRISAIINRMKAKTEKKGIDKIFDIVEANTRDLVEVIALGIHNKKGDPPKWLRDALMDEFSFGQLEAIFKRVYGRLDVSTFFGIMGSIREINILTDTQEIEVPKPQSAA